MVPTMKEAEPTKGPPLMPQSLDARPAQVGLFSIHCRYREGKPFWVELIRGRPLVSITTSGNPSHFKKLQVRLGSRVRTRYFPPHPFKPTNYCGGNEQILALSHCHLKRFVP